MLRGGKKGIPEAGGKKSGHGGPASPGRVSGVRQAVPSWGRRLDLGERRAVHVGGLVVGTGA